MAQTTFVDTVTPVVSSWLNDVDKNVYGPTAPAGTLRADLLLTNSATKGSGQVGYDAATAYTTGSVGYAIKNFTAGNSGVDVVATPAAFAGIDPTGVADSRAGFQAFFDACKGKRGFIPAGVYKIDVSTTPITLDPLFSYHVEGAGWSAKGTTGGTRFNVSGAQNFLQIIALVENTDRRIILGHFSAFGDTTETSAGATINFTAATEGAVTGEAGCGIYAYNCTQLYVHDVFFSDFRTNGYSGDACYSSTITNSFFIKSRKSNIRLNRRCNAFALSNVKAYGSPRFYSNQIYANVDINGAAAKENLAIDCDRNCDFSAAGQNAFQTWSMNNATLSKRITSVVITGSPGSQTGTVNLDTAAFHTFATGDLFSFLSASANAAWRYPLPFVITSTGTHFFSFTVPSQNLGIPAATYTSATEPNLQVLPASFGIAANYVFGLNINGAYIEESATGATYIGSATRGVSIVGNYIQNGYVATDTSQGIRIDNNYLTGLGSGIYCTSDSRQYIGPGNIYTSGATAIVGAYEQTVTNPQTLLDGQALGRGKGNEATNTGFGTGVLRGLDTSTNGNHNTAMGYFAAGGANLGQGYNISAFGRNAGAAIAAGNALDLFGNNAGQHLTSANDIICIGHNSGQNITTGTGDINIGIDAGSKGSASATGGKNVNVGRNAGKLTTTTQNSKCTIVGYMADGTDLSGKDNCTAIGYDAQEQLRLLAGNNNIALGNLSIGGIYAKVSSISLYSDARDKKDIADIPVGLDFINKVRPVVFTWNPRPGRGDSSNREWGVIAQELEKPVKEYGVEYSKLVIATPDQYWATPGNLLFPLIKAVQELSAKVDMLEKKLAAKTKK